MERSKGTLATAIGKNEPLNEIRDLKNTIQQQILSLVHWLVSMYDLRNPKRQFKNSNMAIPSEGIFRGTVPVREVRIPFSTKMLTRVGFESSQQRVTGGKFLF